MKNDRATGLCVWRARQALFAVLAGLVVVFVGYRVSAHDGATGIVKERMEAMKSMGAAMKAVAAMLRGEAPYDVARVEALAREIAEHGGAAITERFPEGSLHKPTRALPAIWTEWDRFSAMADRLGGYATALGAAARNERPNGGLAAGGVTDTADGMPPLSVARLSEMPPDIAFDLLAKSCAQCHNQFRQKKWPHDDRWIGMDMTGNGRL